MHEVGKISKENKRGDEKERRTVVSKIAYLAYLHNSHTYCSDSCSCFSVLCILLIDFFVLLFLLLFISFLLVYSLLSSDTYCS
jgi:hypothetical protein